MAVNLTNADSALKSIYLDAVSHQLDNNVNPLLAAIKKSTNDVWGKEVRKLATYGINAGIGAGTEDGALPKASGNKYAQFVTTLKNLYGVIEISDKAIRASENNAGAFVNLLNSEMEGLLRASTFNFGRMLFGNGSAKLAKAIKVNNRTIEVDSTASIMEGMTIEVRSSAGDLYEDFAEMKVLQVDRVAKTVIVSTNTNTEDQFPEESQVCLSGSYGNEITGLEAIFNSPMLYGLNRYENSWMNPYKKEGVGEINELTIQTALDTIEENSGKGVNFIVCSWGVRRALQQLFASNKRIIDTMELNGGFKAISYNGIPIVADRFCPPGTMYMLNTEDFTLHQLCDWQWLSDDDGKVLKQVPGKPVYTATLVKYADLICARPNGQGVLTGITEA